MLGKTLTLIVVAERKKIEQQLENRRRFCRIKMQLYSFSHCNKTIYELKILEISREGFSYAFSNITSSNSFKLQHLKGLCRGIRHASKQVGPTSNKFMLSPWNRAKSFNAALCTPEGLRLFPHINSLFVLISLRLFPNSQVIPSVHVSISMSRSCIRYQLSMEDEGLLRYTLGADCCGINPKVVRFSRFYKSSLLSMLLRIESVKYQAQVISSKATER